MMRTLLILCILVSSHFAVSAELREEDKQKHLGASAGIAAVSYGSLRMMKVKKWKAFFIAAGVTITAGLAKEFSDPQFDSKDMEANTLGMSIGLVIPITFEF